MTATTVGPVDGLTLRVEGREIACRRPTHGELDLGMLQRLLQVVIGYQGRIAAIEAAPEAGSVVKIANLLSLCGEAIDEIQQRVHRFLGAAGGAETLAWFDGGGEVEVARRASEIAVALIVALARPARLGKSAPS